MTTRVAAGLGTRLLDRALVTAVARAGAPGRIRFTERQLYYELCRVLRRPLHVVPRGIPLMPALPVRYERYEEVLRRHGNVTGLLAAVPESGTSRQSRHPLEPSEPDLYDYGLPRLLVCQSRSVARMLLANDVHLEAACPVFAADDLPLDTRLLTGLGRVEGATVHVLHDASVEGIALTARVRAEVSGAVAVSGAFEVSGVRATAGIRVTSMGLVPRHATALRLISRRGPARDLGAAGLPAALEPHELDWLAQGRFAEVESVPPDRLLRAVLRLVRGPKTPGHSAWSGLRDLRTAGFMTWPTN